MPFISLGEDPWFSRWTHLASQSATSVRWNPTTERKCWKKTSFRIRIWDRIANSDPSSTLWCDVIDWLQHWRIQPFVHPQFCHLNLNTSRHWSSKRKLHNDIVSYSPMTLKASIDQNGQIENSGKWNEFLKTLLCQMARPQPRLCFELRVNLAFRHFQARGRQPTGDAKAAKPESKPVQRP
jgi:hypothetical protein